MSKKIAKVLYIKNAFRCKILMLRDYRFQFNIKILSEGVMMINFVSKSSDFVQLVIGKNRFYRNFTECSINH